MRCNQTDFLTGQISDKPMTYCISFRPKCDPSVFEVFHCLKYFGDFANFISHIISILQKCGSLTYGNIIRLYKGLLATPVSNDILIKSGALVQYNTVLRGMRCSKMYISAVSLYKYISITMKTCKYL